MKQGCLPRSKITKEDCTHHKSPTVPPPTDWGADPPSPAKNRKARSWGAVVAREHAILKTDVRRRNVPSEFKSKGMLSVLTQKPHIRHLQDNQAAEQLAQRTPQQGAEGVGENKYGECHVLEHRPRGDAQIGGHERETRR